MITTPRAIAHRGEPVDHRENTLPALQAALDLGADLIEIDVKVTADGAVVLLHDATLQRLWGRADAIGDVTVDDLSALTLPGESGRGIPTLLETLDLLSGTETGLLIDMDVADWAEPSQRVVREAVGAGVVSPDQIVWCGRIEPLLIIRENDPDARIFLSWDEGNAGGEPPPDDAVRALSPEVYNPHFPMITPDVITWAAERGMATGCWTVDDEALMIKLLDGGVSTMISNRIGTLRKVLDARTRH